MSYFELAVSCSHGLSIHSSLSDHQKVCLILSLRRDPPGGHLPGGLCLTCFLRTGCFSNWNRINALPVSGYHWLIHISYGAGSLPYHRRLSLCALFNYNVFVSCLCGLSPALAAAPWGILQYWFIWETKLGCGKARLLLPSKTVWLTTNADFMVPEPDAKDATEVSISWRSQVNHIYFHPSTCLLAGYIVPFLC